MLSEIVIASATPSRGFPIMLSFKDVSDVRKFAAAEGIEFISFYVSDIDGRFRNVTIPTAYFTEKTVSEGIGIDASNLGFAAVDRSDMLIKPDLNFAFLDPVEPDAKILYFVCDIVNIDTEESFSQDLRHIVGKAVAALARRASPTRSRSAWNSSSTSSTIFTAP